MGCMQTRNGLHLKTWVERPPSKLILKLPMWRGPPRCKRYHILSQVGKLYFDILLLLVSLKHATQSIKIIRMSIFKIKVLRLFHIFHKKSSYNRKKLSLFYIEISLTHQDLIHSTKRSRSVFKSSN